MLEDNERNDDGQEASESAAEGPGNVTVDEPTDPSLDGGDDAPFRDGVPEPGTGDAKES